MRKEIIETGKTVEEAINSACEKLGYQREDTEWEILDLPKKSFLGLKVIPAKVKVWVEQKEEEPKRMASEKTEPRKPVEKFKEKSIDKPIPKIEKEPEVVQQGNQKKHQEMSPEVKAKAEMAKNYLADVCKEMGIEGEYTAYSEDEGICIEVSGQGLGALIGRRGETLDALQYLVGLVANRLEGDYLRITVDCGDYRTKRKATLESLAKKLSAQVLKTNVSKTLEPMNPFERRIIHATVSEIEGVSSISVGEEPNRRVVISSPTSKRAGRDRTGSRPIRNSQSSSSPNSGDRRPRSGGPRRDRDRGGRTSTAGGAIKTLPQSPPAEPKKTPESSSDKPLYTKLDLE